MEVVFDLPRRVCLADPGLPCYSASRPSPSRMIASHGHSKLLPMPTGSITRLPPLHLLLFVLSPMLCTTTSCLTISDDLPNLVHMLWCKRLNVSCPSIRCYCSSRWFDVSSRSGSSPAFLLLEKDRDPQSLLPSATPELIAVDIICIKASSPADYGPDRSLGLSVRRTRQRRPGSLDSTTDCTETNSDGRRAMR